VQTTRPRLHEETACALCGRREYSIIATRDRNRRPLTTVMCEVCGLVWTNPRPSDEDVDRYYATQYRLDYTNRRAPSARKLLRGLVEADERRRALGELLDGASRVLDVGCGAGEFVHLLRLRGIDATGIEPGEEYAEFSRRVLGIPIQTASVDSAVVEPESQDVVTMFHMLEHVADPRSVLATIRGWLRPAGTLVVEVPNIGSTVQAPNHRFHFAHLYNFNGATLGALGESVGLSCRQTFESDDGGNVTCVFEGGLAPRPVAGLSDNVARMRSTLRRHTTVRHYLTATPYLRALRRLMRRRLENRILGARPTVEAVVAWVSGQAEARSRFASANTRRVN
jgi:2-polyprenyl-3-methyl-5-hydroxy-6-metoxy-1,4-benzoquinol methylase